MKNVVYFILKALSVIKIFKVLSWLFSHIEKELDYKDQVNFEAYAVTAGLTNNLIFLIKSLFYTT